MNLGDLTVNALLAKHPWLSYVVPFAAFALVVLAWPGWPASPRLDAVVRTVVLLAVIWLFAKPVLSFRMTRPLATVGIGIAVFLLWIAPDQIMPGYRDSILFQNGITGKLTSSMAVEVRSDPIVLGLRFLRATLIVPIVEELFWRGWLGRWLDRMEDFQGVPLGQFSTFSFVATMVLFGAEHGPYWEVGLAAGAIYNWWMMRTKSLGDLIWCHAVTNGCLSIWVLATGQWNYW